VVFVGFLAVWLAVSTEILLSFMAQVGGIFVLREGKIGVKK